MEIKTCQFYGHGLGAGNLTQEGKPDLLDRFADGLERASKRMKAVEGSPEYQRKMREAPIRSKWLAITGAVSFIIFLLALWFCNWMGWPKQIYFVVLPMALLSGMQLVGNRLADKQIKRDFE